MIVPNYVPEPLEVPGNIADEPYAVRSAFIRRVTLLHLASILLLGATACLPWPSIPLPVISISFAAVLVGLDLWRIWRRGLKIEATVSTAVLPLALLLGAWTAHQGIEQGWPIDSVAAGLVCAAVYTALCGRDFSFVGCTALSLICSSVTIAAYALQAGYSGSQAAAALALNAGYLLYFQYDLASLLSRRRRGEELAAIVDLYRDVFNFFGYVVRLVRHWRKHRIWA